MKAILAILFLAVACCGAAETNRTGAPVLNAHQQFYVNYRAQRARLQRAVSDLDTAIAKEELINRKKSEAGQSKSITTEAYNMGRRRAVINQEIAALDVARLEYEKKHPDAAAFANAPVVRVESEQQPQPPILISGARVPPTNSAQPPQRFPVRRVNNLQRSGLQRVESPP
jgi:hypothetical protein